MKSATIFLGNCGLVQVGYLPEMENEKAVYHLRVNIIVGNGWSLMNVEEINDFFSFLRKQEDCCGVGGNDGDTLNPSSNFSYEKAGITRIIRITHDRNNLRTVTFPNVMVMRRILSFEKMINEFLFQKEVFREEIFNDMNNIIENLAKKCHQSAAKSPEYLKEIGGKTLDEFILELSTNFFSFFSNFYYLKYTN